MDVISSDMKITSEMRKDAEDQVRTLIEDKDEINQAEISKKIKNYFDKKYEPNWHCIIGKNFQVSFSHEEETYILIRIGKITILLFKMN